MLAMHGPHQVAQNSITYTLPGSKSVTGSFSEIQCSILIGGAFDPIVSGSAALLDATDPINSSANNPYRLPFPQMTFILDFPLLSSASW